MRLSLRGRYLPRHNPKAAFATPNQTVPLSPHPDLPRGGIPSRSPSRQSEPRQPPSFTIKHTADARPTPLSQTAPASSPACAPPAASTSANYMGALYNWVNLQNETDPRHRPAPPTTASSSSPTGTPSPPTTRTPASSSRNVFEIALDFLAAGLDPERSTIFIQSPRPATRRASPPPQHDHPRLLARARSHLQKISRSSSKKKILLPTASSAIPSSSPPTSSSIGPHFVPVGQDQIAHVEITPRSRPSLQLPLQQWSKSTSRSTGWKRAP